MSKRKQRIERSRQYRAKKSSEGVSDLISSYGNAWDEYHRTNERLAAQCASSIAGSRLKRTLNSFKPQYRVQSERGNIGRSLTGRLWTYEEALAIAIYLLPKWAQHGHGELYVTYNFKTITVVNRDIRITDEQMFWVSLARRKPELFDYDYIEANQYQVRKVLEKILGEKT